MGRARGVKLTTTRIDISDGDWIDVRDYLTAGQENDVLTRSFEGFSEDGGSRFDQQMFGYVAVAHHVRGWSLVGLDEQPIAWPSDGTLEARVAVLRELDTDTFDEIRNAVAKHREAMADRKKRQGVSGSSPSTPTSPSAV